ncbi:MAG: GIY-YIG nuclease family protein [Calditrichaeota bacterium]|nr:GIY-YIG nuclease family protein [Calditrichota bacterium]
MHRAECPVKQITCPGVGATGAAAARDAVRLLWLTAHAIEAGALHSAAVQTAITYVLVVQLGHSFAGVIGKLGWCRLQQGYYLYVGSARRGIGQRVARHIRHKKVRRWHIDYLTTATAATVVGALLSAERGECALQKFLRERGCQPVLPGFGASDCSSGCESHLLRLNDQHSFLADLLRSEAQDGVQTFVLGTS